MSISAIAQRSKSVALTSPSASVELGNLEADVVAALVERDDLGVVPLVAEPLTVGETAASAQAGQSRNRLRDTLLPSYGR